MEHNEFTEGNEKSEVEEKKLSSEDFSEISEGRILNTRLIALFVIGALIGITLKTHAVRTLTMGFEDYKLAKYSSDYNVEDELESEEEAEEEALEDNIVEDGDQAEELNEDEVQVEPSEELIN